MSDSALETVEQVPESQPPAESPSFEQFSKDRKAGKVDATTGGDEIASGGNRWDGEKGKFVNPVRDEATGRFAKVRESLAQSERKSRYVAAVLAGTVAPTEEMDADSWAAARNAQVRAQADKITPPDFGEGEERSADGAGTPAEAQLTAEQIAHNAADQALQTRLRVRLEAPEVKSLVGAMATAAQRGATPFFFDELGHFAADHDNGEQILFHLGANPEKLTAYSFMTRDQLKDIVRGLSRELAAGEKRIAPKPKPPEPVGARATASAFDVSDENSDPEVWARERNKQVAARRRR
jgi:hypothetical protein